MDSIYSNILLYESFRKQVELHPNNIAIELEDGRKITYENLSALADILCELIQPTVTLAQKNSPNTPLVAVVMTRDFAVIAAILAILKSGAAYVPVDPTFPPDRQSYIFQQSQCLILITDEKSYGNAKALGVELPQTLILHSETTAVVENNIRQVIINNDNISNNKNFQSSLAEAKQRLGYVLYTSGSTGKPKGVMVRQEGVCNIIGWFGNEMDINPTSKVLGLTTLSFDISVLEVFMTITRGATLALAKSKMQKDPFRLLDFIKVAKVNVMQATPTTYEMMLATGWSGNENMDFLVGGEAYRPTLNAITRKCKSFRNVYGPTETTIWSSSYTIPPRAEDDATPLPIGYPISQTSFYIVSTEGPPTLLPEGQEGELWIGGIGVALGYLGRPDLTEQRFIPNPFGEGYIYRTGDIAKELPPGKGGYVFGRRMDDQIKLHGYRIELSEIEQVYAKDKSIAKAVALVRKDKLVLYVQALNGIVLKDSKLDEMTKAASRALPVYMIPSDIVVVEQFPTTANGKLDRNALPDPVPKYQDLGVDMTKMHDEKHPEVVTMNGKSNMNNNTVTYTKMEEHIATIIFNIRGIKPKPTSSFAMLGIDSLGAVIFIRVLSESIGGLPLQASVVYAEGQNIRSLSKILIERLATDRPEVLIRLGITDATAEIALLQSLEAGVDMLENIDEDKNGSFDDYILANRRLVEGVRGFFAFLVLFDHFHRPDLHVTEAIASDTGLFVMLTGFTTTLQLRERIETYLQQSNNSKESNGIIVTNNIANRKFDWRNFLFTRAFGIFPILWLGLLSSTLWWQLHEMYGFKGIPRKNKIVCDILYPLGLQFLYRPQCRNYGPNTMAYASIIWTLCLAYALLRSLFTKFQNYFLTLSNQYPHSPLANKISEIFWDLTFNKPNSTITPVTITIFWVVLMELLFYFVSLLGNGRIYVQLFLGGCAAANVAEIFYNYNKFYEKTHPDAFEPISIIDQQSTTSSQSNPSNLWNKYVNLLWQYSPDIVMIATAILLSPVGRLNDRKLGTFLYNMIIVSCFIVYLTIVFTQAEPYRKNFSRIIFESTPMNILGYCSYALYIFQYLLLDFYLRYIVSPIHTHRSAFKYHKYYGNFDGWFSSQNEGFKFAFICVLVVVCWLIHKYYQDKFVAYIYLQVINRFGRHDTTEQSKPEDIISFQTMTTQSVTRSSKSGRKIQQNLLSQPPTGKLTTSPIVTNLYSNVHSEVEVEMIESNSAYDLV